MSLQGGLSFYREIEQEIFYKDMAEPIGTRRADFVVERKILVELKAIVKLEDVHLAQILNYILHMTGSWLVDQFWKQSLTFKDLFSKISEIHTSV